MPITFILSRLYGGDVESFYWNVMSSKGFQLLKIKNPFLGHFRKSLIYNNLLDTPKKRGFLYGELIHRHSATSIRFSATNGIKRQRLGGCGVHNVSTKFHDDEVIQIDFVFFLGNV